VPSKTNIRILNVEPGNAKWPKGKPMPIVVTISDPKGRRYEGKLELVEEGMREAEIHSIMPLGGNLDKLAYQVPAVRKPLRYRIVVRGTESEWYSITLRVKPAVTRLDVKYEYPKYTGLKPKSVKGASGDIRALLGTYVSLRIHTSVPVAGGALRFEGGRERKCLPDKAKTSLRARFPVLGDGKYRIAITDETGVLTTSPVAYRIQAIADQAPAVNFSIPGQDINAAPGETVKLVIKATDDYGVAALVLNVQKGDEGRPKAIVNWHEFKTPKDIDQPYQIRIDPKEYKEGDVLVYFAEATDNRAYQGGDTPKQPNRSRSLKYKIFIQDKKAAAEDRLEQMNELFQRLTKVLSLQRVLRKQTAALSTVADVAAVGGGAKRIHGGQLQVRRDTLDITKTVKFDEQLLPIKQTLILLAQNEMAGAIHKAEALGSAVKAAEASSISKGLLGNQDEIIATLEKILDIVPMMADTAKEDLENKPASDLPPEALAKLKNLRDRLKEFIDEQKKVIEASDDIAKKPVDDFTEEDKKKLDELAAVEDKWEKFMAEAISDLSKVPEIDASNPTLARELVEVKTDIEMAKGALQKKVMELIVPLEELGRESAEEIVENLERWLMDQPDRLKWSQEEPVGDAEIPMAELPEQLEDIIGDLFEEEEDLFEDAEDITSAWGDSIDKGAGWDTMDGPISNFSAKGVTGNVLPNTSEISGRSGEGRTGKASGEMVEDTATGKGGRRTPTRLTPDAFQKGEIEDTSTDPPGGATGGGKLSGSGQEGLEGPVPPDVGRKMGRLAGRQAQIRNKAERVNAALKVKNYDTFALESAIRTMRSVQRDLAGGRYRNALRKRDVVLKGLKGTKMLLAGEIEIRKDRGAALPKEIEDQVLDAMQKDAPRGFEEYLKHYYQRLSEGK
jgi:hypothetical protein